MRLVLVMICNGLVNKTEARGQRVHNGINISVDNGHYNGARKKVREKGPESNLKLGCGMCQLFFQHRLSASHVSVQLQLILLRLALGTQLFQLKKLSSN